MTEATDGLAESHSVERAAARAVGALTFDPIDLICDQRVCPLERDGLVVFKDPGHLSANFNRTLADEIAAFLARLVA